MDLAYNGVSTILTKDDSMKKTGLLIVLAVMTAACARAGEKTAVREGLLLKNALGVVRKVPDVDVWQFFPTEAIVLSDETTLAAGVPLSLLPCSVLEQMATLAGEANEIEVRLLALFTEYEQTNFLYSVTFLPMKAKTTEPEGKDDGPRDPAGQAPDEDTVIPADILAKIRANQAPDLKLFEHIAKVTGDVNLINRTGYLKQAGKLKYFQPDAFGRKVDRSQYRLLPCAMLKTAERNMNQSAGRQRYNVSGLVTVYKGRRYILLRRAERTYTHGNFTP